MRLHLARNLVHWGGQLRWSYGVTLLPLAVVFALEFTTPAWVTLLAVLILRERLTASGSRQSPSAFSACWWSCGRALPRCSRRASWCWPPR